jgi:hypothetical protein
LNKNESNQNYDRESRDQLLKSAKKARGVSRVNAWDGNVLGDNGAGANDDTITNGNGEDGSVCSDTYEVAQLGLAPKDPFLCRAAIDERIINEHRPMRNEAVVSDRYQLADK